MIEYTSESVIEYAQTNNLEQELFALVLSEPPQDMEKFDELCWAIGLKKKDDRTVEIENGDAPFYAEMAMSIFSKLDESLIFPIFFNDSRENLALSYFGGPFFEVEDIAFISECDEEVEASFLRHLIEVEKGRYLVKREQVLKLIELYNEGLSISLALLEFDQVASFDCSAGLSYKYTKEMLEKYPPDEFASEVVDIVRELVGTGRLDAGSYKLLWKGCCR